ncbi:MAG TPA: hypothetical protein VG365_18110, partial [Solirubrobacteraceae bacterium]|nr:hypothetical protein [Solirubrobacteraceae bacterium]
MIDAEHDDELREVADALRRWQPVTSSPPSIADAAAAAGLLDLAYTTFDSPLGRLLLARTPVGLARVAYVDGEQEEAVLAEMAGRISPRLLSAPRQLDESRRELDEYFSGRRRSFDVALDLR